ncbi:hypothetical protein QN277_024798 [Acacia crassicarpa]|uniref:Uncharacterized protein n=1 Tax=Acacia crassicarpa TaxID=499986 RepID=A0AAE1JCZ3_9FABA|nr:hypothetical protein QN277_024798 [Acacia crassicarpa]
MKKRELSWEFKQQLQKSICEFEEKLKTPQTCDELSREFEQNVKESNAEFEEKLKKDRADLECIIQYMKSEAEALIKEIDRQDPIVKKWWRKLQKRGKRHKELAQVMQVIQQQAEEELMRKVMQHQAEQELMRKAMQQRAELELRKLNLPPNSSHNYYYWPSYFSSFASM